jgi:hypothetical protein
MVPAETRSDPPGIRRDSTDRAASSAHSNRHASIRMRATFAPHQETVAFRASGTAPLGDADEVVRVGPAFRMPRRDRCVERA